MSETKDKPAATVEGADLLELGRAAIEKARKAGAQHAAAGVSRQREVSVTWRDGKIEKLQEATRRSLGIRLYVDGRFSSVQTSDLRPEAIDVFLRNAVTMTRALVPDPHRVLPDPALYQGQAKLDLELVDPRYDAVTAVERRLVAQEAEEAARQTPGSQAILSVTTDASDTSSEMHLVTSNGFEGSRRDTSFFASASVSVKDADGRRPEDDSYAGGRRFAELAAAGRPALIGRDAAKRAMRRLGSKKGASAPLTILVENRAAGRLVNFLGAALNGQALQQKRSFLEGKLGKQVGSALLDVADDPLLVRGFGSRLFDSEGIAARRRPILEAGVLRAYFIDTYYGRKLGVPPTTGRFANLAWKLGARSLDALVAENKDGLLVTSFLGGNSNAATGDFSVGVAGVRIRGGALAESVSEMNVSGNHLDFWNRLIAVGNDPYPYSTARTPTLVFDKVQVAGT